MACAAPTRAQVPAYGAPQLQARSNLLVNDNGWNLPPGSSFNSISAVLNDERWVAFPVQVVTHVGNPGLSGTGIWHGRDGVGAIVHRHDGGELISPEVAINAAGEVAYRLWPDVGNDQLWFHDPLQGGVVQVSTLPLIPTRIGNLSLTDARVIGFQGVFGTGRAFASTLAFAAPADSQVHAYDSTLDPGSPYSFLYSPAMNGERVMAGKVHVQGDSNRQEIRLFPLGAASTRLAATTNLDPGSPFDRFDNGLAVNDAGQVALAVRLTSGSVRAVYRLEAGAAVEIARVGTHGLLEIDSFRPAINHAGLVAFRGRDAAGQAVFVGDGSAAPLRAIGKGDAVMTDLGPGRLGQHIDNPSSWPVFSGAPGINGHGDLVVVAGLHPDGDNQVEWGSGVMVVPVRGDAIFGDGFEAP